MFGAIPRPIPTLALVVVLCGVPAAAQEAVRVYVSPPAETPGGFIDDDTQRLIDSTADLVKAIEKVKEITLVASSEEAQVVLSVTSSRREVSGTKSTIGPRMPYNLPRTTTTEDVTEPTVRVSLRAGAYETEFVGESRSHWGEAAKGVGRAFRKWLKENRARLP